MKNTHIKRIIVAFASASLFLSMLLCGGCSSGKNYDEEIADLQAQIDELKQEHEQFAAEHKAIMEQLEGKDETTEAEENETESTTTTTTKGGSNNGKTSKTTTPTTKKPDDDGFGTEVGM